MASLFWVGGTNTWNTTAGTKWATTSGGAGGAAVPTAADDVFFDANSGVATVTLATGIACKNLDMTGSVATISHPTLVAWTVAGTLFKLVSGKYSAANGTTNRIDFTSTAGTCLITTAGNTTCSFTFNGIGGTWQLQDAHTSFAVTTMTLTNGTFDTNGKTCSWGFFSSSNANTRTVTLGSSSVSLTGVGGTLWDFGTTTGLTFNSGTSTIQATGVHTGSVTFAGGSQTFSTVILNIRRGITMTLSGNNTFANLTVAQAATGTGTNLINPAISGNNTVTGTLTISGGTAVNDRVVMSSSTAGTARTITAAAVSLSNADFKDIAAAGAAIPWTGTSLGNAGGNSNITFTTAVTRYAVAAGNWSASIWATTSGGASGASVPLPQDTAILDANSGAGTITGNEVMLPTIDCTGYTGTLAVTQSNTHFCGSLTLNATMTATLSASALVFNGRGTHTITSGGKAFTGISGVTVQPFGGSYTLQDDLNMSATSSVLGFSGGTLDANGHNVTCGQFSSSNPNTRTLNMGSGTWTLAGTGTVWNAVTTTGLTLNASTSTIVISDISATAKTFTAGTAVVLNNLTITGGGSGSVTLTSNCTYNNLTIGAPKTIIFTAGAGIKTIAGTFTAIGSVGNIITINSGSPGSTFTLSKASGTVSADYLSLTDSVATGGASWYAGPNSTNVSNNTGWIFTAPVTGGNIKVYSGSAFVVKPVKVWNGSAWVTKPLKRWNGSAWVKTNY